MADFKRIPGKFAYSGMDVHHPPDLLPPDKCSILFNLHPDILSGALAMRPPIAALATTPNASPIHSLIRVNDSIPGAVTPFSRFAGVGGGVYSGAAGALTLIEAGYSGNPLAMVPYRPAQSPEPWLYVFDSLQQRRYKTDQTKQNIGIAAPTADPTITRTPPGYVFITTAGAWAGSNPVGGTITAVPVPVARVPAAATAATVLYDTGTVGMACIVPTAANFKWMTSTSSLIIDAEPIFIEEVFPPLSAMTVGAIQYDVGASGLCTIVPSSFPIGLKRNQLVILNGISVRVLSVTSGPDGTYSFRCNTGGSTIAAGQTLTSPASFRAWTVNNHVGGAALSGNAISATLTPVATGAAMSAVMSVSSAGIDTTHTAIANNDYVHVSIFFDNPQYVTEVHFMIDVGDGTFTHDYYYFVARQSDFGQSALGGPIPGSVGTTQAELSAIESGIANQLSRDVLYKTPQASFPAPEVPSFSQPVPQNFNVGAGVWVDVMFKLGDMTRVGTNPAFGLQALTSFGALIYVNGGIVNAQVANPYMSGGLGPDCNFNTYGPQAPPMQWRYRYRNSLTGARSTVSPETRSGETLRRQSVSLTYPNSPDTQVDTVDFERRGGTNPDWHYVGSVPQGLPFVDNVTEVAAQIGDALEIKCYQPWPVTDMPRTGTATVTGTSIVWASGDTFNVRYLRGTSIIIGGNTYSLFAPPASTTRLQLAQHVPVGGVQQFQIPEATIEGQPLYGCWLDEANNKICGVGDPLNPGFMYFGNNDNPDGASDNGYIEVTSPSEPLLNGFYAEGSNYVFTSSGLYKVESTPGGVNPYASYRLSGVPGLAGAWAFDAQRRLLFYWGPDGIYVYGFGAEAQSLTLHDLYPLFPHAGIPEGVGGLPISIHGITIYPPNYAQSLLLRISYSEGFLYATYQNLVAGLETLVYSTDMKGWRKDTYNPTATMFVLEKGVANPVLMVGGSDGNLYQVDPTGLATADAGGPINWNIITPAKDDGDSRDNKQWGDLMLDYATGANLATPGLLVVWDNLLIDGPNPAVTLSATRTQAIFNLITPPQILDAPVLHRNMALALSGTGPIYLFEWQPSLIHLPEDTTARVGNWQTGFTPGFKWINGVIIHSDTNGLPKQIKIEYDNQQLSIVLTINHNGEQRLPYYFAPIYAHQLRIVSLDNVPWHDWHDEEWIGNAEPEYGGALAVNWLNGGTTHYKFVQGIKLHADTFGQPKQVQIQYEGGIVGPTLTINHNGEQILPYSWLAPFKAHLMRVVSLDNVPWRFWADSEWVFQLEPEPTNYWISQPTTFDMQGFIHMREVWPCYACPMGGVIVVVVDGVGVAAFQLPPSATPQKIYRSSPPAKGKLWQISASGTGLQLYERDTEFLVKSWGSAGPFQRVHPFGDQSGGGSASGARI